MVQYIQFQIYFAENKIESFKCGLCSKEFVCELTLQHCLSKHEIDNEDSKSFADIRSTGSTTIMVDDDDITSQQQLKLWEAYVKVIAYILYLCS